MRLADFDQVMSYVKAEIVQRGLSVLEMNLDKPWGGYIRLQDTDARQFAAAYFPGRQFATFANLSPKFLMINPHARLSWQYHLRRNALWRVLSGPVAIKTSTDNFQPAEPTVLTRGQAVDFAAGVRHRLIGTDSYGIVTEIWQHIDPKHPSDEADLIRVEDDYGR